jgi:anti-sigma28 factor (negative regulator of flagellin synthesis)
MATLQQQSSTAVMKQSHTQSAMSASSTAVMKQSHMQSAMSASTSCKMATLQQVCEIKARISN